MTDDVKEDQKPRRTIWYYLGLIKILTVEPMMFFYSVGWAITNVTNISLMEYKICKFDKGFCDEVCDHFTDDAYSIQMKEIQKTLSDYNTITEYAQNFPALFWCLFIGEWSDKHGRKKPMLLSIFMKAATSVGMLLCHLFDTIPTYGVVLSYIPTSLFNGFIFTLCLCYISDITDKKSRMSRIALCSGLSFLGYPLGTFLGGEVYRLAGFTGVYLTSIGCLSISLIYGAIRLKETRTQNAPICKVIKDLFQISNVKKGIQTIKKKREGGKRKYLIVCLLILGLENAFLIGSETVQFQYSQLIFNWEITDYTRFSSTGQVFNKVVNVFITPFLSTKLHISEPVVGILGSISGLSAICTKVALRLVAFFYMAEMLFGLHYMSIAATRSFLSKNVNENELGKAYAMASALECTCSLIFSTVNQQIYKATLSFYPGFPFVVAGFIMIPILIMFLWIDLKMRRNKRKNIKEKEVTEEIEQKEAVEKIEDNEEVVKTTKF